MVSLHPIERKTLLSINKEGISPSEIVKATGLDINQVMRALDWLSGKGLVRIDEGVDEVISLGDEGRLYLEKGLPEKRVADFLKKGPKGVDDIKNVIDPSEVSIAIGWLRKKGIAEFKGGRLKLLNEDVEKTGDEEVLELLARGPLNKKEFSEDLKPWVAQLLGRKNVLSSVEKVNRLVYLTSKGREIVKKGVALESSGIGQLTPEIIKKGAWIGKNFRPYDLKADVAYYGGAKSHPMTRMVDDIKDIFLAMGFSEIEGPLVESNFWNFDALFVPQDHPAREMQDTFYLEHPSKSSLPDEHILRSVKEVHENGGGTGSHGWGYDYKADLASQTLLRTHTTSTTIRYLAQKNPLPIKVFSIGRVFRKERISYKHLPEFTQIEGIVVGDVNFRHLLGILKEFYSRMGFDKIRFRPAYFPYTEPSLEVEVYFQDKESWIELGGAGIFRPEVTLPLGVDKPVLAWGLGLERLAMLRLDLKDIRTLYWSDIKWLQNLPL